MVAGFRYIKIRLKLTVSVFLLQRCLEILGYSRNAVAIPSSKGPSSDELGGFASFTSDIGGLKKVVSFIKALECDMCVTHIFPNIFSPLNNGFSLFKLWGNHKTNRLKQDDMRKLPNSRWMVTQRKPHDFSQFVTMRKQSRTETNDLLRKSPGWFQHIPRRWMSTWIIIACTGWKVKTVWNRQPV